jgi:hypothetical protein
MESVYPIVMRAVHKLLMESSERLQDLLNMMWGALKPALEDIGDLLIRFGPHIQTGIEVFSVSLDRVQRIFDEIMRRISGNGDNEEEMLYHTFNLFDVSNTGYVTAADMQQVATLYSMVELQGQLAVDLVDRYDWDFDGRLQKDEMQLLVNGPQIPQAMPIMLRAYANSLAQVGGRLASATQRDEIAEAVVDYLQVVVVKNATKVSWIADRLGNGSLPLAFTANVFAELCSRANGTSLVPGYFTSSDVGAKIISELVRLHPNETTSALLMLSNASFWVDQGMEVTDQPACLDLVINWVATSSSTTPVDATLPSGIGDLSDLVTAVLQGDRSALGLLRTQPTIVTELAEQRLAGLRNQHLQEHRQRQRVSSSETAELLLNNLLGGPAARPLQSDVDQSIRAGEPAAPETMEFAMFLRNNATRNANMFLDMCFRYSSQSSSQMDNFATTIRGATAQIQSFLNMIMSYATKDGIERIETAITNFQQNGMPEVIRIVEDKLGRLLNRSAPAIENAIHDATHQAALTLSNTVRTGIGAVMGQALIDPLTNVLSGWINDFSVASALSQQIAQELGGIVQNATGDALADATESLLEAAVAQAISRADDMIRQAAQERAAALTRHLHPVLLQMASKNVMEQRAKEVVSGDGDDTFAMFDSLFEEEAEDRQVPSGPVDTVPLLNPDAGLVVNSISWRNLVTVLESFLRIIPPADHALRFAKREWGALAEDVDVIFYTLGHGAPPLFSEASRLWKRLWVTYFICLLPISLFSIYYAMWAGGYFGGPSVQEEEGDIPKPKTWRAKLRVLWRSSTFCMKDYHDTTACFWSTLILTESIVFLIYLAAVVLCLFAFMRTAVWWTCSHLYVLYDPATCDSIIGNLSKFLSSFVLSSTGASHLENSCSDHGLITCAIITEDMHRHHVLTVGCGFLGTLCYLHLIIESAILHEEARFRRTLIKLRDAEKDKDAGAPTSEEEEAPKHASV